jgi:hypothetical protein
MTPPSSPRAGEPKTDLRASLTDALDYWWNFDEESGQRRTSHATLESIIPSMVAEVLARRMESQGWRAGEAEGGVREATVYAREQLAIALAAIRDADRNFRDDAYCRECGKGPSVLQHDDPDCSLSPLAMADIAMRAARGAIGAALAPPEPDERREMRRLLDAGTVPGTCWNHRTYDCWMCRPRIAKEAASR